MQQQQGPDWLPQCCRCACYCCNNEVSGDQCTDTGFNEVKKINNPTLRCEGCFIQDAPISGEVWVMWLWWRWTPPPPPHPKHRPLSYSNWFALNHWSLNLLTGAGESMQILTDRRGLDLRTERTEKAADTTRANGESQRTTLENSTSMSKEMMKLDYKSALWKRDVLCDFWLLNKSMCCCGKVKLQQVLGQYSHEC